jgi:tRNA A-37 threonylcarbamoyl transferase component Bud32
VSLVNFSLPDSVAVLGREAFGNCEKLSSIEISQTSSLKKIGDYTFSECSALKSLFFPKCFEEFKVSAFYGSGIESVTIDEGNEFFRVSEGFILNKSQTVAIRCLSSAVQITIPAFVEILGEYCFAHCNWISDVTFAEGSRLRQIAKSAFLFCSLRSISIPVSVEVICANCFACCPSLVAVFYEGDSCLREIGLRAFWGCEALTLLYIPKTVQVIDPSAFEDSGLESIIVDEANQCFVFDEDLLLDHSRTNLILALACSECISIPSTVKTLSQFCFSGNKVLMTTEIPNTIEDIPEGCFSYCSNLAKFFWKSGSVVRRIEAHAFSCCSSLRTVIVPASVEFLGEGCFCHCTSLTVVTFEADSRLKQIGRAAFVWCIALEKFDLPPSVEVIDKFSFAVCISLSEFCVPRDSRLQRIETRSFYICPALSYFHLPSSIKFIGGEALSLCKNFDIECPDHVNAVCEWRVRSLLNRVRSLLNRESTLDLSSLPLSKDLQTRVFDFSRLEHVSYIGDGAQGEVRLYKEKASGDRIAVKSSRLRDEDIVDTTDNGPIPLEVRSLMRFHHPCIVPLLGYDFQIDSKMLRIAMPYIGPYSLEKVLESPQKHPWFTLTAKTIIVVGIVIGMIFIHFVDIVHRDLKPANVLLDEYRHYPKIADFGLSREGDANNPMTTVTVDPFHWAIDTHRAMTVTDPDDGTLLYKAPEIIAGQSYSTQADVFSFGALLYEIVTGKPPCQGCGLYSVDRFAEKVTAGDREPIPDTVEPFPKWLIERCCDGDPFKRPTFLQIFFELQAREFKLFSTVDSPAVEQFLQSLQ